MLLGYCVQHGISVYRIYVDDGYSGMNFQRPDFQALLMDIERGQINMVITKDLSRLGRDYIMTGYYSEVYFPAKGVRYVALADGVDSMNGDNDIAPFKNILNDMYARDISKKIRNAKHQRAKQGLFIGSQAPYGYQKSTEKKNSLAVDPEVCGIVRLIFTLAESGLGDVAIAHELEVRRVPTPSVYKFQQGDHRFANYPSVQEGRPFAWSPRTVGQILRNRVYPGELASLKTQTVNCKTKQKQAVPREQQVVTQHAHKAIITPEQFAAVQAIRSQRPCPARNRRFNLFRGKLYCECCGHPLMISRKQLLHGEADIYFCAHHYTHPNDCPKTHRVYHDMLYPYVLQQTQSFAKTMKRKKVNAPIREYSTIHELTPEILDEVIERIEIGHVTSKSRPGNVIRIHWKLR